MTADSPMFALHLPTVHFFTVIANFGCKCVHMDEKPTHLDKKYDMIVNEKICSCCHSSCTEYIELLPMWLLPKSERQMAYPRSTALDNRESGNRGWAAGRDGWRKQIIGPRPRQSMVCSARSHSPSLSQSSRTPSLRRHLRRLRRGRPVHHLWRRHKVVFFDAMAATPPFAI